MQGSPLAESRAGAEKWRHMAHRELQPGRAPLQLWRRILAEPGPVALADAAWPDIERARGIVEAALAAGRVLYGVNTGFGKLAQTPIASDELKALQRNLVLSHAAGVGAPEIVRLAGMLPVGGCLFWPCATPLLSSRRPRYVVIPAQSRNPSRHRGGCGGSCGCLLAGMTGDAGFSPSRSARRRAG